MASAAVSNMSPPGSTGSLKRCEKNDAMLRCFRPASISNTTVLREGIWYDAAVQVDMSRLAELPCPSKCDMLN